MTVTQLLWTVAMPSVPLLSVPALALGTILFVQLSCYVEEWIFKALPGFNYHWTVALVELLLFTAAGRIGVGSAAERRGPLHVYAGVGFSLALGTGLGKIAFRHLNYATGTVLKSMKLLPVLALSACWLGRVYSAAEVVAACLMVAAAALFGLGERALEPSFHPVGIALSFACLGAQAVQSNLQDTLLRDRGCSVHEVMLYANAFGAIAVLILTICTGELAAAIPFFLSSHHALALLLVRSLSFYVGALFYTMLMQRAGAVTAVAVTTLRKILTVVMSFAFFPKPWSDHYAYGGVCLLVALILDARAHHARGGPPRSEADGRDTAGELQPMRPRTRAHPSDSEEEGAPLK